MPKSPLIVRLKIISLRSRNSSPSLFATARGQIAMKRDYFHFFEVLLHKFEFIFTHTSVRRKNRKIFHVSIALYQLYFPVQMLLSPMCTAQEFLNYKNVSDKRL